MGVAMSADGVVRAFLSHASENKAFVEAVAQQLGRQYCVFDKYEFASGVEFRQAIDRGLDQSGIFVLFASKQSLAKFWVGYEMDEARARIIRGAIDRILVYVIDSAVDIADVPEFFKRAKIEVGMTAAQIARDIVMHVEDMLRLRGGKYYVGRGADHDTFSRLMLNRVGGRSPNLFFIHGLPGIGRREFLRRVGRDSLSLRKQVQIRVGEGHTIHDLLIQLGDAAGTTSTKRSLAVEAARIRGLSEDQACSEVVELLREMVSSAELPVIVDEGGLLSGNATLEEWFRPVLAALRGGADTYCAIVSNRKVQDASEFGLVIHRLAPIDADATKLLISQHAADAGLLLDDQQLDEFAKYVSGYPPAAQYAVQQALEYGVELILASKERLVDFRRKFFLGYIEKLGLGADGVSSVLLRVLSSFSPLPLPALARCAKEDAEAVAASIARLIDISLVNVDGGLYRIADPAAEAAAKHFGLPSPAESKLVAHALRDLLEDAELDVRRLDVSRALFKAARIAGDDALAEGVVRLTSDVVGLVERCYHERRYEDAVRAGMLAMDEAPRAVHALGYLVRALVQLERWERAEEFLNRYKALAPLRDYYFLKAFMAKRKGEIDDAIRFYELSHDAGRTGVSISRELSQCYAFVEDYEKANRYLREALSREGENRFVLDLWATIAAHLNDRAGAEEALGRLQSVDEPMFYLFRKSRIEWLFGDPVAALIAAREAVKCNARPPFQVLAQLALCEQVAGSAEEAAKLIDQLDRDFGSTRKDVRTGLRVRWLLSQDQAEAASTLLETTRNKRSKSYSFLKRDVLLGLSKSATNPEVARAFASQAEDYSSRLGDKLPDIAELDVQA